MLTKYVPNLESQDSRLELENNRGRNTLKAFFFFLSKRFNNVYECGPKPIKVPSRLCYSIIKSNNNKMLGGIRGSLSTYLLYSESGF